MSDVFSESSGFSAHAVEKAEGFYGKASAALQDGVKFYLEEEWNNAGGNFCNALVFSAKGRAAYKEESNLKANHQAAILFLQTIAKAEKGNPTPYWRELLLQALQHVIPGTDHYIIVMKVLNNPSKPLEEILDIPPDKERQARVKTLFEAFPGIAVHELCTCRLR
ncbi:MAG: hypothetical protein AB7G80_08125 [Dongiaceae bacterium]